MPEAEKAENAQPSAREMIAPWVEELTHHLEIDEVEVDIDALLKLAGEAAHTVVRPAAPVTTFLIGYVTGLAEASGQADYQKALSAASDVTRRLLERRSQATG
ncbi:DUF6457 domain-containing protein [Nesterenkonia muleiensis]|uniref:DUF6457 domain-containing protein n=1 Tax=Nesterenkonia muleiensis TaxID=2282648 RepID=UPI001EE45195|nr:DUF6457 domain-containing protein [Nesterenkonia muleiensis]